jgi:hypothetical protein
MRMQDLKELTLLLQQHGIQPFKGVGANSKLLSFWDGIIKGRFSTDETASKVLYNEGIEGSKYRKLKSDFRDRLFDAVLQIEGNHKTYSDYQKAYYECHRQWAIVRILTGQNANTAALMLSRRLLRQAEKFDFTLLGMDLSSYLHSQYGLRESNDKKFRETHLIFERFRKLYDQESKAEEMYTNLVVKFVNQRSSTEEVHKLAVEYFDALLPLMEEFQSYKFQMYSYLIALMCYTTVHDHQKALYYCEEALRFFESRQYEPRVPLQIFYYQRLLCNIQLRQFGEGEQSAKYCLKMMQDGTFNWFKYRELYMQLSLHTEQYDKGAAILVETIAHKKFEFLPENVKEIWRIYEAFIH